MTKSRIFTPSFISLAVCNFLGAMNFYLLTAIFTEYSLRTYGLDYSTAALSVSMYIIGALLARIVLGGQIDRWGLKKSLVGGYVIIAATTCLYVFALPYPALIAARFIQGIGFGVSSGAGASGAAILVPADRRSEGIGYFSMTQALATGIGPFVAIGLIGITNDYQALFVVASICAVLMVVLCVFVKLPSARDNVESKGAATMALEVGASECVDVATTAPEAGESAHTASAAAVTAATPATPVTAATKKEPALASTPLHGIDRFVHRKVVPFGLVMFMAYVCYAGMITYMTLYAGDLGFSDMASFYFVVYAAAILVSRPPMGRRADRLGENSVIVFTLPCLALGLVALGAAGSLHISWLMLLSALLTGFGLGSTHSVLQAVVPKVVPTSELGRGNSTYLMMLDLGSGIGPVALGFLVPVIGYAAMYYLLAIWALAGLALYYFVHGRHQ